MALSDLISDSKDPQDPAAPTPGPADPSAGATASSGMGRLTGFTKQHPRASIALIAGVGIALAGVAISHRHAAPAHVVLPPVKVASAVKPKKSGPAVKSQGVTLFGASSPAGEAARASAPAKPSPVASAAAAASQAVGQGGAGLIPVQSPVVTSPQADQAQQDRAVAEQTQARAMFLQASQGSVQLARIQKVQAGLYAVAYVVGGRSGQAWVDVPAKVVFIGQAVDASGKVLVPGSVALAQGAVAPEQAAMGAATPKAGQASAGSTASASSAMAAVLVDHQAGFWDGSVRAPDKIWAFVDPDNKDSMEFFQEIKPLIRAGQLRAYWIPVGVYDRDSSGKAAFILAQLGQLHALSENYATFLAHGNHGAAQVDTKSPAMSLRVMQNNDLLTGLGKLELPAVLTCTPKGSLTTLYKPSIQVLVNAFGPCSKDTLRLAGLSD